MRRGERPVMRFPIGTSGQTIIFREEVVARLLAHRQLSWWQAEAGGQLFARLGPDTIEIVEATGPRKKDGRGRSYYHPNKQAEQAEIEARFPAGLHFVGDWHTHAEPCPMPSRSDLTSIEDAVRRSRHELNGFILAVVGQAGLPEGLHLSVHDGWSAVRLHPEDSGRQPEVLDAAPMRRLMRLI